MNLSFVDFNPLQAFPLYYNNSNDLLCSLRAKFSHISIYAQLIHKTSKSKYSQNILDICNSINIFFEKFSSYSLQTQHNKDFNLIISDIIKLFDLIIKEKNIDVNFNSQKLIINVNSCEFKQLFTFVFEKILENTIPNTFLSISIHNKQNEYLIIFQGDFHFQKSKSVILNFLISQDINLKKILTQNKNFDEQDNFNMNFLRFNEQTNSIIIALPPDCA